MRVAISGLLILKVLIVQLRLFAQPQGRTLGVMAQLTAANLAQPVKFNHLRFGTRLATGQALQVEAAEESCHAIIEFSKL